jgi:hypothetical protein
MSYDEVMINYQMIQMYGSEDAKTLNVIRMFFKWVVVGRVMVGDLRTPPENSAEGSVQ